MLTKWRFRGRHIFFGLLLLVLLHPVPDRADPDGAHPRACSASPASIWGLILVHVIYGLGFTTLYLPQLLRSLPDRAGARGADRRRELLPDLLAHPAAVVGPIIVVTVIWQFTNIWNDFLFGASFSELRFDRRSRWRSTTSSTPRPGVKEYNVHFAGAILAALPTLVVYIVSGRYFVRGLMAGAVKG